jgi:ankyrin repeat protein
MTHRGGSRSHDRTTALLAHDLARTGKTESLFNLIANTGAGLVVRSSAEGQTLVATAAEHGQLAVVKGLLRRHREWIDLDAQDDHGWTALHYAAAFPPHLRAALDQLHAQPHDDPESKKKKMNSMIMKKKKKRKEAVDMNAVGGPMATQVTTRAVLRSYFDRDQDSVVDLSELEDQAKRLEKTKLRLVQILLEAGADPNIASLSEGLTPFHVADTEALALRLLMAEGLDRSVRSKYAQLSAHTHHRTRTTAHAHTPHAYAHSRNSHVKHTTKNRRGESLLHVASKRGYERAVRELLSRPVPDVRLRTFGDTTGMSARDVAASKTITALLLGSFSSFFVLCRLSLSFFLLSTLTRITAKEEEIKDASSGVAMVPLRGCARPNIVWKTPLAKNAERSVSFSVSESPRTLLELHLKLRASTCPDLSAAYEGYFSRYLFSKLIYLFQFFNPEINLVRLLFW